MKVEATDLMDPRLVCVSFISRVVGRLLKVITLILLGIIGVYPPPELRNGSLGQLFLYIFLLATDTF